MIKVIEGKKVFIPKPLNIRKSVTGDYEVYFEEAM